MREEEWILSQRNVRKNEAIMKTQNSEVHSRNDFVGRPEMHHCISVSLADEQHRGILERSVSITVEVVRAAIF